jgi:hypothetical protein
MFVYLIILTFLIKSTSLLENYLKVLNQITSIEKIKSLTKLSPQLINSNKKNILYENYDHFLKDNIDYKNKKIIRIGDGGINGFYLLGISSYIKKNYDLSDFIFSGVSAGSWNSIIMSYKKEPSDIIFNLMHDLKKFNKEEHSIYNLQVKLKTLLLEKYSNNDFYLDKAFHAVTCFKYKDNSINTILYCNFNNLEDMVNSAMASSHIPLITGGYINKYKGKISFDGGLSYNPYINKESFFTIESLLWNNESIVNAFNQKDVDYMNLFMKGYTDSEKNKKYLDSIFNKL